ncbi:class I SAM-dependent methyltransferase [Streptomyces sp. NPDC002589]|uniref:class I SAM-dependent methyltransferase n=1 Tax=Streptomyces sp. NPDC002589 TaxID=3154420 RepID=UPI0033251AF3
MADPQGDVFGVDISVEMIATARESEQRDPLAVRYDVGDVAELPPLDPRFDVAVGVQCLNYAEDIAAMERMRRNIHRSLLPGGEFFVLAHKPDYPFGCPSLDRYGFRCEPTGEEIETGPRARVTVLLDPQPISIVTTAPRREVYEECLRATGFSAVEWVPLWESEAGIREFGEDFWADLLDKPPLEMLRCRA